MEEVLRLENIRYSYDHRIPALKDVSVRVGRGERVAVLGNNGAGKSTFFLCCNRILRPQQGRIFLRGREITDAKKDILALRQAVGVVFQDPDSQMIAGTVEDEISFGPMNLGLAADEVRRRVDEAVMRMDLKGYERRAPQYLSGGEKKRVSIADILAMRPDVILLDEPTASLDPRNTDRLEAALAQLHREGMTLVVSTHDADFAYRFAARVIVFADGEIAADGSPEDVFSSEAVLARAGLKRPLLYETYRLLCDAFPEAAAERAPTRIEDMRRYILGLKTPRR